MPAIGYGKYDQAYTSTQNMTGNHGQDAEEESPASGGETETVGKPTDMQNVQDITETVMEESGGRNYTNYMGTSPVTPVNRER